MVRRTSPAGTRVRRSRAERKEIAVGWAGVLVFAALLTFYIWIRPFPFWRAVERLTNSEYILRHHQSSTGIYWWSLVAAIGQGLLAYLLIVPNLPVTKTLAGNARIAVALVLTVSNALLLLFSLGYRKRGYSTGTSTAENLWLHGVGYETGHMLQSVIHAALATLLGLAVAGAGIQAGLRNLPARMRLGLVLLAIPVIAVAASLIFARPYLS